MAHRSVKRLSVPTLFLIVLSFNIPVLAKPVTLELVCNDPPELRPGTYERAIKLFEASHPNIKVKYGLANGSEYIAYLLTRAAGGSMPDVFYHRSQNTQLFASKGLIRVLDPYIKRSKLDISDFWEPQLDELSYRKKLYVLPENYSSWGVSYNVEVARESGLVVPTGPWSWDELRATAMKLTKKDGNKTVRFGFQFGIWDVWAMLGLFYGKSGSIYSPDFKTCTIGNPKNAELLKMLGSMIDQGYVPPAGRGDFANKKVAMSYDGSWVTDYWRKQLKGNHFDIAYAPTGEFTGKPSSGNSGAGYVVSAGSKHPDEAYQLVEFLTSTKILDGLVIEKMVNIPGRKSASEDFIKKVVSTGDPSNARIWLDSASRGWSVPSTPYHQDLIKSLTANLNLFWTKKKSADAALELVEKEVGIAMRRKSGM